MFERFSQPARRVVVSAQQEARQLEHDYIGTEHLLLGVLGGDETAARQALIESGVSYDVVRKRVEDVVGRSAAPAGHIPFTPAAKKALEMSLRESRGLDTGYIGTAHELLGLLRVEDGLAYELLVDLGVDIDALRARLRELARDADEELGDNPPAQ
jgi:ATP-dependent Clp protease ATP-binding subunit ClpC